MKGLWTISLSSKLLAIFVMIFVSSCQIANEDIKLYPFESEEGYWGYMNSKGKVVIKPEYAWAEEFSEGLALVSNSHGPHQQSGFIDKDGKEVIPYIYWDAGSFSDGAARVSLATNSSDHRWTYIDNQGNQLFNKEFELVRDFCEGYAAVVKEGTIRPIPLEWSISPPKWSYIDKSGEFVTDLMFDEAYDFCYGFAVVKNSDKYGVIDSSFCLVVDYQFNTLSECNEYIKMELL